MGPGVEGGRGGRRRRRWRYDPRVHATVVTLFPALLEAYLGTSVVARGVRAGHLRVDLVDLRRHGEGPHRVVDDRPFGGGPGMVLMAVGMLMKAAMLPVRIDWQMHPPTAPTPAGWWCATCPRPRSSCRRPSGGPCC